MSDEDLEHWRSLCQRVEADETQSSVVMQRATLRSLLARLDNAEAGQARTEVYVDWGEPVSAFPDGEPPNPDVWRKIAEW